MKKATDDIEKSLDQGLKELKEGNIIIYKKGCLID